MTFLTLQILSKTLAGELFKKIKSIIATSPFFPSYIVKSFNQFLLREWRQRGSLSLLEKFWVHESLALRPVLPAVTVYAGPARQRLASVKCECLKKHRDVKSLWVGR